MMKRRGPRTEPFYISGPGVRIPETINPCVLSAVRFFGGESCGCTFDLPD